MPKRWILACGCGAVLLMAVAEGQTRLNVAWQAPGTQHANAAALITSFGPARPWGIGVGVTNYRGDALTDTALYGCWRPWTHPLHCARGLARLSPYLAFGLGATLRGRLMIHPLIGANLQLGGRWSLCGVYKRRISWERFAGHPIHDNQLLVGLGVTFGCRADRDD